MRKIVFWGKLMLAQKQELFGLQCRWINSVHVSNIFRLFNLNAKLLTGFLLRNEEKIRASSDRGRVGRF